MIVSTMTKEEICQEITKDFHELDGLLSHKREKLISWMKRNWIKPIIVSCKSSTKNKNTFILIYSLYTKKKYNLTVICTSQTPKGLYCYQYTPSGDIWFFAPHFFKRYQERMKINKNQDDVIIEYFSRNSKFTFVPDIEDEPPYKFIGWGITKEGIIISEAEDDKQIVFKTFIPLDMLSEKQKKKYLEYERADNIELSEYQSLLGTYF